MAIYMEGTAAPLNRRERKAVVLLSGGVDSATTLAIAKTQGFETYALTVRYGQRHGAEVAAAQRVAQQMGVSEHAIVDVDLARFGGSALTDDIPVPKDRTPDDIDRDIPTTYVPARNTVFLSLALGWAETLGASDIFIGANALDYSGYPDCRPEYIAAFERMANLATKGGVEGRMHLKIHIPLIKMSKKEIVKKGLDLGVDFTLTMSCYDPSATGEACGQCDACLLRLKGFQEAGVKDPAGYRAATEPRQ